MERETLERWYADYGFAVHRRCLALLGSSADADDALHEVFMKAHRHGDDVRETPLGWLYRVADRHCFDVMRGRRRMNTSTSAEAALERGNREPTVAVPEQRRLVAQVLAECKPRVQQVAVRYYLDELTQEEVAADLGVSRKTVKEKLQQFKDTARRLLGPREGGAP